MFSVKGDMAEMLSNRPLKDKSSLLFHLINNIFKTLFDRGNKKARHNNRFVVALLVGKVTVHGICYTKNSVCLVIRNAFFN